MVFLGHITVQFSAQVPQFQRPNATIFRAYHSSTPNKRQQVLNVGTH